MNGWVVLACALAWTPSPDPAPSAALRETMVRRYTMSGYIRPLLFWIGRDDIGLARVTWRRGAGDARGYELLIGTDPRRAPRSLNRWGFISEELSDGDAAILALMTRADESSYEEAAASTGTGAARGDFRAISTRAAGDMVTWQIAAVPSPEPLTIHDVDAVLTRVVGATAAASRREMRAPPDIRRGFLSALAELLDRSAQVARTPRPRAEDKQPRLRYLFGGRLYDLQLRRFERGVERVGPDSVAVLRSEFEIRTLATGARTRFDLASGLDGRLAGVPVTVAWQPRWWLKIRLQLTE